MLIVGIDPSLSNTAVATALADSPNVHRVQCWQSKNQGDSVHQRMRRYRGLVADISRVLAEQRPIVVFIEAYSFSRNDAGARWCTEYGALLRWHLADLTDEIYEVAPTTLKKFATGKGSGKKEQMIAHVTKRYGLIFDTSDEVDAFALLQLGLAVKGVLPAANQAQRETVDTVLGKGKPKRKRKSA